MPLPTPTSSTMSPGRTTASIARRKASVRTRSQIIVRCTSISAYIGSGGFLIGVRTRALFSAYPARPCRRLRYQRASAPVGKSSTRAHQFVTVVLIEGSGLKVVGEVDGL